MALLAEETKKKIHIRNTDFFLKNFRPVTQDIQRSRIKQIVDVELECLGYGVFNPKTLLDNFITYTVQMLRWFGPASSIRSLKLIINGFELDPSDPVLKKLAKQIPNIKDNLNVLWIHTSNLKNVTLQNFNDLLKVINDLSNINFEDYSLQCANWRFIPNQPTCKDLNKIFEDLVKTMDFVKIQNKHFRLQMSGWYYTLGDAKAFLGFKLSQNQLKKVPKQMRARYAEGNEFNEQAFEKQLQRFFLDMEQLLKSLLNIMDNIEQLELDMRNTHDILKMKNLKKRLDNLSKQNRYQMSIMSKKVDVQADQAQKELRLNIVM